MVKQKKGKLRVFLTRFLFPLTALLTLLWALISGYVAYHVTHPDGEQEVVDPSSYLLPFKEIGWKGKGDVDLSGWYIQAKPTAPVIFLCHGYGSNRARLLSLAERLYAAGLSSMIPSLRGHASGASGFTTLGWHEPEDLLLARDEMRKNKLLVQQKLGVWGVDLGAYTALAVAAEDEDVVAVAVDTPYLSVSDFLNRRTGWFMGDEYWPFQKGVRMVFSLLVAGSPLEPLPLLRADALDRFNLLVLVGEGSSASVAVSEGMLPVRTNIKVVHVPKSRSQQMSGPSLKAYDQQVASFFHGQKW